MSGEELAHVDPGRLPRVQRLGHWPDKTELGRFVIRCSCMRWSFIGTAAEADVAAREHDDSPWINHVVTIWGKVL
jgi:hypothetical protein